MCKKKCRKKRFSFDFDERTANEKNLFSISHMELSEKQLWRKP